MEMSYYVMEMSQSLLGTCIFFAYRFTFVPCFGNEAQKVLTHTQYMAVP